MATAEEVFQALNEQAGFKPDNENWTEDTFTQKEIIPGKVYLYFQTGTGAECDVPNFGFGHENLDKTELYNLRVELGNILGEVPEETDGFVYTNIGDLDDRSVEWAINTMKELERRIQFEFSK